MLYIDVSSNSLIYSFELPKISLCLHSGRFTFRFLKLGRNTWIEFLLANLIEYLKLFWNLVKYDWIIWNFWKFRVFKFSGKNICSFKITGHLNHLKLLDSIRILSGGFSFSKVQIIEKILRCRTLISSFFLPLLEAITEFHVISYWSEELKL